MNTFPSKAIPMFIKMDIEGAARIIREYKPKLAICAYYKPEDV